MNLTGDGYLGIGTTTPASSLQIYNPNPIGGGGTIVGNIWFAGPNIDMSYEGGSDGSFTFNNTSALAGASTNFAAQGGAKITILSVNGYVGINTPAPTTNLDVNGAIRIRAGVSGTAGKVLTDTDGAGTAGWRDIVYAP